MADHNLDQGKHRFRQLVAKGMEALPRLPLVHSTDTYNLVEAVNDGALKPQPCNVFKGELLTYFFYGRPSFRPNATETPSGLGHYFPIVFIFKQKSFCSIKRVFPFDSGAFKEGYYKSHLHKNMQLGDFALEADITSPGRLIQLFFGSVPAYLNARPQTTSAFDSSEFEAFSYASLVNSKESNSLDSRGSGIEFQTEDEISLQEAVEAVILPGTFADQSTGKRLQAMGIEIIPYRTFDRMKPGEYTTQITDICFDYYIRKELIKSGDL